MVLYLRLIKLMIRMMWDKSKVDPFKPFVREFTVRLTDMDFLGHMTNSRYFSLMDLVRIEFLTRSGIWPKEVRKTHTGFAGLLMARFRKELKRKDKFQISYQIVAVTKTAYFTEVKFIKNGFVHCHAIEKQYIYEIKKGIISPISIFQNLGMKDNLLEIPEHIQHLIETDRMLKEFEKAAEKK